MRHRKSGRKLGRTTSHRKALLRSLAASLFEHEKIETTLVKAKEARPFAERLITMARKGTLAHRRRALAVLNDKRIVRKLFDDIGKRYADRPGGYTRILKLDKWRLGDGTQQAILELVVPEAGGGKAKAAKPAVQPKPEPQPTPVPEPADTTGGDAEAAGPPDPSAEPPQHRAEPESQPTSEGPEPSDSDK